MNRKILKCIPAYLMGCVIIHGGPDTILTAETFQKYEGWKLDLPLLSIMQDAIILKDGTRAFGSIETLPPIQYGFGTVHLMPEEVSFASFTVKDGIVKAHYLTRDGLHYFGPISAGPIVLGHDVQSVQYIIFHDRNYKSRIDAVRNRIFHIELKNGDLIPIISTRECLSLRSKGKYYECLAGDILEFDFDRNKHLVIQTATGRKEFTDFAIRNKFFPFYLVDTNEVVKVPWIDISKILRDGIPAKFIDVESPVKQPDEVAMATEGFIVNLHPIPPISLSENKDSGVTVRHGDSVEEDSLLGSPVEKTEKQPIQEKKPPELILQYFDEFDSPIQVAYDLESGAGRSIVIEGTDLDENTDIAALEPKEEIALEEIEKDVLPTHEKVSITPEELIRIQDELIFEYVATRDFIPESFSVELADHLDDEEEDFPIEKYELSGGEKEKDLSELVASLHGQLLAETPVHEADPEEENKIEDDSLNVEEKDDVSSDDFVYLFDQLVSEVSVQEVEPEGENKIKDDSSNVEEEQKDLSEEAPSLEEQFLAEISEQQAEPEEENRIEEDSSNAEEEEKVLSEIVASLHGQLLAEIPEQQAEPEEENRIEEDSSNVEEEEKGLSEMVASLHGQILEEILFVNEEAQAHPKIVLSFDPSVARNKKYSPILYPFDTRTYSVWDPQLDEDTNESMDTLRLSALTQNDKMTIVQFRDATHEKEVDDNPVMSAQYLKFVQSTAHRIPRHWRDGKIPAGQENMPIANVSYRDAQAYAKWAGRRLPTAEEIHENSKNSWNVEWSEEGLINWVASPEKYKDGDYSTGFAYFRTAKVK